MKVKIHIATTQFSFIEIDGEEEDMKKMIELQNEYGDTLKKKEIEFDVVETFTGEKIKYNDTLHRYTDMNGNALVSGSQYKKQFDKPFPKEHILKAVSKKYGVEKDIIDDMWSNNGKISRTFGNAIHYSMEQWFKHNSNGCDEKEYHLPKHPILRKAVESFPDKDADILPELMVSSVKNKMVGQIDGLAVTGYKEGYLIDYKTDANIDDNLDGHFIQLSFYAFILKQFGWDIKRLVVWNYTDKWKSYESDVLDLKK